MDKPVSITHFEQSQTQDTWLHKNIPVYNHYSYMYNTDLPYISGHPVCGLPIISIQGYQELFTSYCNVFLCDVNVIVNLQVANVL